jgi:hypothetical protein
MSDFVDRNVLIAHVNFWGTLISLNEKDGKSGAARDYTICYDMAWQLLKNFDARDAEMERATKVIMDAFPDAVEIKDWKSTE